MTSAYGFYTYGVVDKVPLSLDMRGIDQNKVYAIAGRDLWAMVSEININSFQQRVANLASALTEKTDGAKSVIEEMLRAHEGVVDTLMKDTTIIPFQFGTILKDEKAITKMLQDAEEKFKYLLVKFNGRVEWGLKVYTDTQEFMKHITKIEPGFSTLAKKRERLSRGAAYLLGKKMEEELKREVVNWLARTSEAIFQELGKEAYESRLNKTLPQKLTDKKKEMILNSVFLVEKERVAHFCEEGKRLIEQYAPLKLDLEMSGPWAPYSFID